MEEDTSLDDFFAKKDKSKKKSKVKSGMAGDSEDVTKSTKKEKKKDKNKLNSANSSSNRSHDRKKGDDDEWNDFEEEKAVDYSGLRIQNLQKKGDQENDGEGDEEELDEYGEVKDKKDGVSGPWKKGTPNAATPAVADEKPAPAPAPVSTGKYIPPSQRAALASSASSVPSSRRKKELPNIRSELDFPTLAIGQEDKPSGNDMPGQRRGVNLALENKFSVLQD